MFMYFKPPRRGDEGRRKIFTFAALLAKQLLDNKWDCESEDASNATPTQMLPPPPRLSGNAEVWQRPQSAPARYQTYAADLPCTSIVIENVDDRSDGDKRKLCHVCYKVQKKNTKTRWWCARCLKGVCGPDTGRRCFDVHVGIVSRGAASESIPETGAEAPHATRRAREMM